MPRPLILPTPSRGLRGLPQLSSLGMWGGGLPPLPFERAQGSPSPESLAGEVLGCVCEGPGVGGHLSTSGPATTRVTPSPAPPRGCLDSWSQECRGLLVGS